MRIAIYPGSFNPFHEGHGDLVNEALDIFDKVIVLQLQNPDKETPTMVTTLDISNHVLHADRVTLNWFSGLLKDTILLYEKTYPKIKFAIIKGLRNQNDFEYEKDQLYLNQDLWSEEDTIMPPTFYIMASRNKAHISSSSIRHLMQFKKNKKD